MDERKHVRRPHYSGRYPKRFEEKYKEQQPEKYSELVDHVISKGNTPAGMHIPIMAEEILQVLSITPGMSGLDCTLGYGGHTEKFLGALNGQGHLCSLDADPIEIGKTTERLRDQGYGPDIWTPVHINFRDADKVSSQFGPFDFVLADLGLSSMQLDNPERGFTYKADGPLDLRFNPKEGEPASQVIRRLTQDELAGMFAENADEPYADEIVRAIFRAGKAGKSPATTKELSSLIEETLKKNREILALPEADREEAVKKSCTRVFQALRIDVNSEMEVLYEFLDKLPSILKSGGKAAVLTFHSGEDRLVKKAFRAGKKAGVYSAASDEVVRPSKEEWFGNPRSRSAKLRWAVRA